MNKGVILLLSAWICTACSERDNACLNDRLPDFKAWCCPNGSTVSTYYFQGDLVQVYQPGSCGADFPSYVLGSACDTLGFLGGIAGFTDIQGVNFPNNATFEKVIWSN
jgi:hypothetical protein|tara:strand:+ start:1511 stop:1834 length:324 start_codon:yes stop_codon:yes gene_type:complete